MNPSQAEPGSLSRLLILGFGSVILILLALTATSLLGFSHLFGQFNQSVLQHEAKASLAHELRVLGRERSLLLLNMSLDADPFERDLLFMQMRERGSQFSAVFERYQELTQSDAERSFLDALQQQIRDVSRLQYHVIDLLHQDQLRQAQRLMVEQAVPTQNQVSEALDQFARDQRALADRVLQQINQDKDRLTQLLLLVCLLGLFLSLVIGHKVSRHISHILRALRHSLGLEQSIRENIHAAIITANSRGEILSCNKATETIFGYPVEQLIGRNLSCLMPEPHARLHDGYMQQYLQTGVKKIIGTGRDVEGKHQSGELIQVNLGISEIQIDGERIFIGVIQDIGLIKQAEATLIQINEHLEQGVRKRTRELEEANRLLRHMARHDIVTGLPNRTQLHEFTERTLKRAHRERTQVAMMFLDLDGFKSVNDRLGHNIGDQVLRETGQRIRTALREEDMVARIGGDEFAVVCAHFHNLDALDRIARDIIAAVGQPFSSANGTCTIGVSIGISIYPRHAHDSEDLLRLADEAMYLIKHDGKNNYALYQQTNGPQQGDP